MYKLSSGINGTYTHGVLQRQFTVTEKTFGVMHGPVSVNTEVNFRFITRQDVRVHPSVQFISHNEH